MIGIHQAYSYRIGITQGIRNVRQCDEAMPSQLANISDPEGEQSYLNRRVDGFIFYNSKTVYLSDMSDIYM